MSESPHPGFNRQEPISGYITRELIGRGGFGEVWKAEAPGGLEKAVKIVHAGIDSDRAERELRALQRIKDVRHPLILSIERIEIVDGTLVVVTELADSSLKDLFKSHRAHGKPGIPREQLLKLLVDAADALDYIYEEYSLQHLDIKPENLLVVGNRLKLGDFGLLKNIYERGASLVSGLTPTYAPPELFEGKPTRQSDQYSLAIVYQHMLTGELPFDGATSAQLAREHLGGVPHLTSLSKAERPIVARALSKVPNERFASCVELISQLVSTPVDPVVEADVPSVSLPTQTISVAIEPERGRDRIADAGPPRHVDQASEHAAPDAVLSAIEARLSPNQSGNRDGSTEITIPTAFVPTVFFGIGGVGGRVLRELQGRFTDAFGGMKNVPAYQMVVLDTDGKDLNSLMRDPDAWGDTDFVALPLRRPEDYQFRDSRLSQWLHRRWLYNMPRSMLTEGYRPLGRLALVDHGRRVLVAIRSAISRAVAADSLAKTTASTGLPLQQGHVRIMIVSSISGATGSGMLLDLAYAVRSELKRRGFSDEDVSACLLHSREGARAEQSKAIANAYATLAELRHYSSAGRSYPGEPEIDAVAFHGDNRTFDTVYLTHLGDKHPGGDTKSTMIRVAEFLYCTTATPAKLKMDTTRRRPESACPVDPGTPLIRAMDAKRFHETESPHVASCIARTCRDVVSLWKTGRIDTATQPKSPRANALAFIDVDTPREDESEDVVRANVCQWMDELGISAEALMKAASDTAAQVCGASPESYFRDLFDQFRSAHAGHEVPHAQVVDAAVRMFDHVIGTADPKSKEASLCGQLHEPLTEYFNRSVRRLSARITALIDAPDERLAAADCAVAAVTVRLRELRDELKREQQQVSAEASQIPSQLRDSASDTRRSTSRWFRSKRQAADEQNSLADGLASYALAQFEQIRLGLLQKQLDQISSKINTLANELNHLTRDLGGLASEFPASPGSGVTGLRTSESGAAREYLHRVESALDRNRQQLAQCVRQEFEQDLLTGDQKLQRFLGAHGQLQKMLAIPLWHAARRAVLDQVQQATLQLIDESAQHAQSDEDSLCIRLLTEFVSSDRSQLGAVRERPVVIVPDVVDPGRLRAAFESNVAAVIVTAKTNGITICWEGDARPVEDAAEAIVDGNDVYRQLAEKLHTRKDVDWQPLPPPQRQLTPTCAVEG